MSVFTCVNTVCCTMHAWWPQTPEEGESLGTGVRNGCELSCGYRELKQGPLQKQQSSKLLSHFCICILFSGLNIKKSFVFIRKFAERCYREKKKEKEKKTERLEMPLLTLNIFHYHCYD